MRARRSRRAERGTGLLGTLAGVTVFLALLTVSLQVMLRLTATSTVQAAAYEAARHVATVGAGDGPAAVVDAEERGRAVLGGLADGATFEWVLDDPAVVELRLTADSPRVLAPVVGGLLGDRAIDRVVRIRREAVQP